MWNVNRCEPQKGMQKGPLTILLADDSEDDVLLFRHALASNGFEGDVVTFDTVTAASIYLKQEGPHENAARPDLIISDSIVDHECGLDLLEWVRVHPRFKEIPFVLLTSNTNPAVTEKATMLGATAVFQKPATYEELIRTAGQILAVPGEGEDTSGRQK